MTYNFTDAWILNSIYFSEEKDDGAQLRNIIAYADFTNHAVFEFSELNDALQKLLENDLIKVLKNGNLQSSKHYHIWVKNRIENKAHYQVFKLIEDTQKFLSKLPTKINDNSLNRKPIISKLEYDIAKEKYLKGIR